MLRKVFVLLLGLPLIAQAELPKQEVDFSNYNVPLYAQIVDHIKVKISSRLGEGSLKHNRYFIIPFAYQDKGNHPEFSHSFITVIRVFGTNRETKLTLGLPTRQYKGWEFEAFNISWLPADFLINPHLCVFDGFGSRTTAFIEKTGSRSVVFMLWPAWKNFIRMADCSELDLRCGGSMVRHEC